MDKTRCFEGICRITFDSTNNIINVVSEIDDWRNETYKLDHITEALSSIANKYSLKRIDNENLLAYACDESNKDLIVSEIESINADCNNQTVTLPINEISLEHRFVKLDSVSTKAIKELFTIDLNLPSYQRPYRWGRKNIEFFFNDIYDISCSRSTYDFGIIVLHRNNGSYDVVDGQQRIVTLALMLRSLSSHVADSFIEKTLLQGRDSEKHIGYNFQWFRLQVTKLQDKDKQRLVDTILNGFIDIVVMDDLDDALKFFDRMNTAGVALTNTDILKSHHLLALSNCKSLSDEVKSRWKKIEGFSDQSLNDMGEFKRKIVIKWEGYNSWWLNKRLSTVCGLRMMACGKYPYSLDDIWDIEQFRDGNTQTAEYSGLDCQICDGEFFFWYVFNLIEKFGKENKECKVYDSHAAYLRELIFKQKAREMFDLLVVYIHEKTDFSNEMNISNRNKVIDLVFSWLIYFCLYYDTLTFSSIRNDAMKEGSIFDSLISCKTLEDCLDCYCENPLEVLINEGLADRVKGNGILYLIRRELRRIYGSSNSNR